MIPQSAVPFVLEVLRGVAEVVGEQVLQVAKQQHPELDMTPVPDEGAAMDDARAEALRRARED